MRDSDLFTPDIKWTKQTHNRSHLVSKCISSVHFRPLSTTSLPREGLWAGAEASIKGEINRADTHWCTLILRQNPTVSVVVKLEDAGQCAMHDYVWVHYSYCKMNPPDP